MPELAETYGYSNEEQFCSALVSGEIALVLLPDEQRSEVCTWLEGQVQGKQLDLTLQEGLASVARSLRAAMNREA